jgi:hypothetical protein
MRRAFHYADAETRDVARYHTDARADGLSRDRARMIRTSSLLKKSHRILNVMG